METDWNDVEAKARVLKAASMEVIEIAHAINDGKVARGRPMHPATIAALKTTDLPAATATAQSALNDLNAAVTA